MFTSILENIYGEYAIYKFIATIILIIAVLFFSRRHFLKISAAISLAVLGFILLFPMGELSDFISRTVSYQTHNRTSLDFEDMSFSWNGGLAIRLDQVFFQMAGFPAMTLKEIVASPDIMAAINQKPYGRVKVSGLFNGEANFSIEKHRPEEGSETKEEQSLIQISASQINLAGIPPLLSNLPFDFPRELYGKMEMSAKIVSILNLKPPVGDDGKPLPVAAPPFQLTGIPEFSMTIKNLDIPPFNLEKGMVMPVGVPALKFAEVSVKGRMFGNTFQIEELQLGKPTDELSGKITGNLIFTKGPAMVMERYEINTDLKFKQSFHDKIGLYLSVLPNNPVRALPTGGYELKTKISGSMPRNFSY